MKKLIFSFVLLSGVFMTNSFANSCYNEKSYFRIVGTKDINTCIERCWKLLDLVGHDHWEYHKCLNECKEFGAYLSSPFDVI